MLEGKGTMKVILIINNNYSDIKRSRHNNIARLVHRTLCCKYDLSRSEKWYDRHPEGVVENERCKTLWDVIF